MEFLPLELNGIMVVRRNDFKLFCIILVKFSKYLLNLKISLIKKLKIFYFFYKTLIKFHGKVNPWRLISIDYALIVSNLPHSTIPIPKNRIKNNTTKILAIIRKASI